MKIASIQMAARDARKRESIARAADLLDRARGADVIVLPELWNIGYFSFERYQTESETLEGETLSMVARKAYELGAYIVSGSIVEEEEGRFYNSNYFFGPDGNAINKYRKIHLFGHGSMERQFLTPGREVVTIQTEFGVFGLATCYDLRFPELFRRMVDCSAELFLVSSAWPSSRLEHWLLFNRVRAVENQVFLISANMTGTSQGNPLCGHSMVVDPWGLVRASAEGDETIVRADIDLEEVKTIRAQFPALQDRVFDLRDGSA